jgi:hypothetical protein
MKLVNAAALAMLTAVLISISACGQPQPQTMASMPLYPGAKEATDPVDLQNLAEFTNNFKLSPAANQVQNIQTKMYIIGNGTTWNQADTFYSAEMKKRGWDSITTIDTSTEHVRRWRNTIQLFAVATLIDPKDPTLRLAVLIASMKPGN